MKTTVLKGIIPELSGHLGSLPSQITGDHRKAFRDEFELSGVDVVKPGTFLFNPKSDFFDRAATTVDLGLKNGGLKSSLTEVNRDVRRLAELGAMAKTNGVLVVLQGVDGSGKGGIVEHALHGNPHHFKAFGFKAPTEAERAEHYLERVKRRLPQKGEVMIFDRSHYEDLIFPTVYGTHSAEVINARYAEIKQFESALHAAGILVVKIFLHISKEEQLKRLVARLEDPLGWGKVGLSDWKDRALRRQILEVYARIFEETHAEDAPWYVVPADDKKSARLIVATIVREFMRPHQDAWIETTLANGLANLEKFKGQIRTE